MILLLSQLLLLRGHRVSTKEQRMLTGQRKKKHLTNSQVCFFQQVTVLQLHSISNLLPLRFCVSSALTALGNTRSSQERRTSVWSLERELWGHSHYISPRDQWYFTLSLLILQAGGFWLFEDCEWRCDYETQELPFIKVKCLKCSPWYWLYHFISPRL